MTLFRSKSIGEELIGRAHRIVGASASHHPREALGAARDYAGQAGALTSQVMGDASRAVRRHPRLGIAIGAGLGLGAIAAAYLLSRRRARMRDEDDAQDSTWQRPTNGSGDPLDGSGRENPVPGETGLY
jgi:hypothetical protein